MPSLLLSAERAIPAGRRTPAGRRCPLLVLSAVVLALSSASCSDAITESPVPAYNVRYSCNVSTINAALGQTDLPNLDCQPGVVLIDQYTAVSTNIGVCGLLLYHAATEDAYYAYDLACPYCFQQGQPVSIGLKDIFTAQCPVCSSEFGAIQYGSPAPTAGPANADNCPLRQYQAHLTGYATLTVTR